MTEIQWERKPKPSLHLRDGKQKPSLACQVFYHTEKGLSEWKWCPEVYFNCIHCTVTRRVCYSFKMSHPGCPFYDVNDLNILKASQFLQSSNLTAVWKNPDILNRFRRFSLAAPLSWLPFCYLVSGMIIVVPVYICDKQLFLEQLAGMAVFRLRQNNVVLYLAIEAIWKKFKATLTLSYPLKGVTDENVQPRIKNYLY